MSNDVEESRVDDKYDEIAKNFKSGRPFELEAIFGLNSQVSIQNLTNEVDSDKIFASASAHVLQIFHCDSNRSQCFVGHENEIISIETDSTGRFIVSSDKGGVVNIWDMKIACEFPHPIRTIYDPYHHHHHQQYYHQNASRLLKIAFSSDGKNIIIASEGNGSSVIKLWQWSYGTSTSDADDTASDMFELPEKYEQVENVRFNCNRNEMFVITCSNGIIFGQWESKQTKLLRHFPSRSISISFRFSDTIFLEKSMRAVSITKCGNVIIWSNSIVRETKSDVKMKKSGAELYKKEFIKSIKLCENPLTVIKSIDEYIVTADTMGKIRFYDEDFKILFWCPSHDFIDSIVTVSFDLTTKFNSEDIAQGQTIRDFLIQTRNEIYAVNFTEMKFTKIFYKSDDFITAMDIFPLNNKRLICCANYSGRLVLYNYEKKRQLIEHQLKLRRRKSSISDIDVIEIPHVSAIAFSRNGHHLFCGLDNGTLICLDVDVLRELKSFDLMENKIVNIKFSPDSFFLVAYDVKCNMIVMNHDKATEEEWLIVGKNRYHTKPICDVLYIPQANSTTKTVNFQKHHHNNNIQTVPRLISLSQDRQIVEYDLLESMKENLNNLVITFTKRIFQTAIPMSMTLIYNSKKHEDHILIADSYMKFKLFDKNTFEILATYNGPIYDSYVKQFDTNTNFGLIVYSEYFMFSTNKNICLYAMPIDGNPYRSLGVMGHCDNIKAIKVDSTRRLLFTIGHKCQSIFMWNINFQVLFDHLEEGGVGLKPYCDLLPGRKYGNLFQEMQNVYYYMLMLSKNLNVDINDRIVKEGLEINEIPDYMRALGYFPSDYEIDCINHELHLSGRRKIGFEELMKLFINHALPPLNGNTLHVDEMEMEKALRSLCNYDDDDVASTDIIITKENLMKILIDESDEKVESKDAEFYLEKLFQGKSEDKISLSDFLQNSLKLNGRIL